jgi:hypothetical protein
MSGSLGSRRALRPNDSDHYNDGRRKPLSVPDWIWSPAEERAEAFATSIAYAGSYTFSGDKVTDHFEAASVQDFVNTDFVRFITKLDRDRLILRALLC